MLHVWIMAIIFIFDAYAFNIFTELFEFIVDLF